MQDNITRTCNLQTGEQSQKLDWTLKYTLLSTPYISYDASFHLGLHLSPPLSFSADPPTLTQAELDEIPELEPMEAADPPRRVRSKL
ncbi:hypothetical protein B0H11DRAFT_2215477 [Mycena galericulata]|nr:hypothetical protein B0H11DRAFT_2215477 [Mycena galericulata]